MKRNDVALLIVLGFVIWLAGTIYYAYRGPAILETTRIRYWGAFGVSSTPFGSSLHRDSSMAAHRPAKLGIGGASARPSWDGW